MEGLLDRSERINEQAVIFFEMVVRMVQEYLSYGPLNASDFIYPLTRSAEFNHKLLTCLVDADLIEAVGRVGKSSTIYSLKGWKPQPSKPENVAVASKFDAGLYITID